MVDPDRYQRLVDEQHARYPSITLPPEYAELFEVNTLQLLVKLARYKFVARLVKRTDSVLEVGSGAGMGAIFVAQHADSVTGLEIKRHDYEAAIAVNRRANVTFHHQSLYDFEVRQFDVVMSIDVIEHMTAAEGQRFVAELSRRCCDTGICIVGSPSIYSYPYQSSYSRAAHIKCYDQAELISLMDSYFARTIAFSMNDEIVHTGHPRLAWYYFVLGLLPIR